MSPPSHKFEIEEWAANLARLGELAAEIEYLVTRDGSGEDKAPRVFRALRVFFDYDDGYTQEALDKALAILGEA